MSSVETTSLRVRPAQSGIFWRGLLGLLLVAIPVTLVLTLIIYPVILSIFDTLTVEATNGYVFSLDAYRFFFSDSFSLSNLWLTVWVALICTILLLAICIPIALYLRFSETRLAGYVQALALFPLFVPSILLAYALIRTLGPNGTVDTLLTALGLPKIPSPYLTPWGPIIGLVWDNLPLTLLIILAGLSNVSRASIDAARDVGAGNIPVFWYIILPRIGGTLLVAASFIILGLFSAFTLPYLLGPAAPEMMGPFMRRTIIDADNPIQARTQAVVTFIICAAFAIFYVRSVARTRREGSS
ncbi:MULTISPECIES: ABC transporter permease [Alphaproteobacteria]|jgi:putative spermidine/putrescine transport system permease protein|uniref:ABC transporter permease subunit n=1 Tax=Paracoccus shanxieyensis TaxID=2675752 RepID=A0A6L6J576_9RHOB|nr:MULTISPECIES: ABC transporter permease subunit [Alphaproteobacteria]MTH65927.1 ABC transporter permease subunit [Paracoccus shanxieyensis]MTH89239.1 ABC transporter permease subunit [Paracoccus shanxieyensis]QBJ26591.1 ABC transporter permease subunit [Haematobacter massiliensis]